MYSFLATQLAPGGGDNSLFALHTAVFELWLSPKALLSSVFRLKRPQDELKIINRQNDEIPMNKSEPIEYIIMTCSLELKSLPAFFCLLKTFLLKTFADMFFIIWIARNYCAENNDGVSLIM